MLGPIIRLGIGGKCAEHGAVLHVVTVEQVIPAVPRTGGIQKRNAPGRWIAVKVPMKVFLRLLRGVHHRVIDLGSLNPEPAPVIRIPFMQRFIGRQRRRLLVFLYGILRWGFLLGAFFSRLCQSLKTPLRFSVLPENRQRV